MSGCTTDERLRTMDERLQTTDERLRTTDERGGDAERCRMEMLDDVEDGRGRASAMGR
ncbi:MAG TPA: hypothetical protein VHE35_30660 [Kofleriaceae bacterium]|nr:hypothetical protein [Kofleriaceae bacterium]